MKARGINLKLLTVAAKHYVKFNCPIDNFLFSDTFYWWFIELCFSFCLFRLLQWNSGVVMQPGCGAEAGA